MNVFLIYIGPKGFLIDVDGMKNRLYENKKNNTHNNKQHKKRIKTKKQ
jgi:hypothetical protein